MLGNDSMYLSLYYLSGTFPNKLLSLATTYISAPHNVFSLWQQQLQEIPQNLFFSAAMLVYVTCPPHPSSSVLPVSRAGFKVTIKIAFNHFSIHLLSPQFYQHDWKDGTGISSW